MVVVHKSVFVARTDKYYYSLISIIEIEKLAAAFYLISILVSMLSVLRI